MSATPGPRERPHPGPITYVKVGSTLTVVTAVEVAIFYLEALKPVVVPMFIVLSAFKFALVAMFYMHLRYDARLFSGFFFGGLALATAVILTLMALFAVFTR